MRCRVDLLHRNINLVLHARQRRLDSLKVTGAKCCARFLQSGPRLRQRRRWIAKIAGGHARVFGCLEPRVELLYARGKVHEGSFCGCSRLRFAVRGSARGVLRALAGVDRVAERLAIIPLRDEVVRFLQRARSCRVLVYGVLVGAGGARGVQRALGLIDFFLGRLGATCGEQQQECDHRQATHFAESIAGMM